jgi:hypothetical protein
VTIEQEKALKRGRRRRQPTMGEMEAELAQMDSDARGLEPEHVPGGERAEGKKPLIL